MMRPSSQSGVLLLELVIALSILLVGILAFLTAVFSSSRTVAVTRDRDDARIVLENMAERIRSTPLDTLYGSFHGRTFQVPEFASSYGGGATLTTTCFVNELALPQEFGPLVDIDGRPGLGTTDCSTTYRLLPICIQLAYESADGPRLEECYLVAGMSH